VVASKSYERGYKLLSQFFRSFVETVHEKDRPLLGEGGPNDIQGHFQLRRKPFRAQLGVLAPLLSASTVSWPARPAVVIPIREIKDAELSPEWLATQLEVALDVVRAALAQQRAVFSWTVSTKLRKKLRKQLVASLVRFAGNHPDMPTIVTSRPAGSPGEVEARCLDTGVFDWRI